MPDGVGDCSQGAGNADLAHAFYTEQIDERIVFCNEDRTDRGDVRVDGHAILRQVSVHDPARPMVGDRLLMEGKGHAPDHASIVLAAHETGIDDASGSKCADQSAYANMTEIGIDLYFRKHGAMRIHRM